MRMHILFSLALLTALAFPSVAFAACSNPAGVEGEIIVNSSFNVPAYCDDTNWVAMSGGNESAGGQPGNGLVAHWRFDETTSVATTADSVGSNDGTFYGGMDPAADSVAGKFGTAFDFDGSDDEIEVPPDASYNDIFAGGGSISLWVYPRSNNNGTFIYKTTNSGTLPEGHTFGFLPYTTGGRLFFRQAWSGGRHEWRTADAVNFNQWNHIVVVFDNSADTNVPTIYVNNVAVAIELYYDIGGGGSAPSEAAVTLWVGWEVDGYMDDIRYYDRELTPADVAQIYNATTADAGGSYGGATQIVPSGLVAHYRMDETTAITVYDSSGNGHNGTMYGSLNGASSSVTGIINKALDFDENPGADRIEIPDAGMPTGTSPPFSFGAWVNVQDGSASQHCARWSLGYGDTSDATNDAQITFNRTCDGITIEIGDTAQAQSTSNYKDKWMHVFITFDGTTGLLYRDANQIRSITPGSFNPPSSRAVIGGRIGGGADFNGYFDDVRFYNRALSQDEIAQIYAARDGIRYNESMRKYEYFDGNKFVSLTPDWKNVDEGVSYDCPNIGDVCSDGSLFAGNASNGDRIYVTSTNLTQRTWKSSAGVNDISTDSSSDGRINVANLNSAITNFPAINQCDTSTLHGQNDWYLPASGELVILNNNRAAIEANAANAFFGASAYWSSTESSTTTNAFRRYFDATTTNQIAKTATHQVRCIRRDSAQVTGTGGLVGHWKMDETTGTTVYDSSGNGNNGTMTNGLDAANDSQPGAVSTSLAIDGIDDGISIGNPAALNNIFNGGATISGWAYIPSTASADGRLLDKNQGGAADGWLLSTLNGSNTLSFDRRFSGSVGSWQSTTSFPRDQWFHYVLTYDDSSNANNPAFYINGTSSAITENVTPTGSADDDSGEVMYIANRQTGNRSLQGSIDDVRIYNRILSSGEIQQLYQMGTPVGSSTALPQGCPNVGDVCDDGTIYAGLSPDGSVRMFTTPVNAPNQCWNNCNGPGTYTLTSVTSRTDGDGNTAALITIDSDSGTAGFQTHEAAQYCYDLVAHGSDDWYLPATDEVLVFYANKNTGELAGTLPDGNYLNSTEESQDRSDTVQMGGGTDYGNPKAGKRITRCARKGPAPRCANPYGLEGQMIYNSTHDVVQFCDGARWIALGK